MIELQDVCYAYGERPVLRHVSFSVAEGECVLLLGDNGSGKTTLMKMLNGLISPHIGRYFFDGTEITEKKMRDHAFSKWFHQRVAFLWQNPDVQLFCTSVEEELAFGPQQMGLSEEEWKKRVEDAVRIFGLGQIRDRVPYYLSGGEKKKTAMASLFTMNPQVWTMDEPLSALDQKTRKWLVEFLCSLKEAGKTLILATHEPEQLREIADREFWIGEA